MIDYESTYGCNEIHRALDMRVSTKIPFPDADELFERNMTALFILYRSRRAFNIIIAVKQWVKIMRYFRPKHIAVNFVFPLITTTS